MKVVFLGGINESWQAAERNHLRDYWTSAENFVFTFEGEHRYNATFEDVSNYDIIIANLNSFALENLRKIQQKRGNVKWVSVIERCATDYLPVNPLVREVLDGSDLVNVINQNTLEFFRALTTARCEYIGIPFPAESIRSLCYSTEREKRIILPPVFDPPAIVMSSSYLAAKDCGLPIQAFQANELSYGYEVKPYLSPLDYMKYIGKSFAVVNLDHRYTWGRTVLECAALGVPCITTVSTGHAWDFFPLLTVQTEFDIYAARYLLNALIKDEKFYRDCSNINLEKMQDYTHESIKNKILSCLR